MSKKQQTVLSYEPREFLDGQLEREIGEILSAETEAREILEKASETAKSIELDGVTRERTLRDAYQKSAAAERERALIDARARAEKECERIVAEATDEGDKLVASKAKDIEKIAKGLFATLGGKVG